MIQPDSTPTLTSPSSTRARPVMIPWRDVARRLAEGEKPASVAAGLAIDEDRIWRHLRKSLRFRTYLRQAIERQRQLGDMLLDGAGRSAMVALGRQPENLDGGLLRCLLDEAGRTVEADAPALARRIEQLGETGAPPPNMAFRRRLAEEKRQMDHQMEVWRIQDAARAAQTAVPTAAPARVAPAAGEPERSQTNANELERTQTNANEAERAETNTSEHQRSATNPTEPGPATRLRWSRPPAPAPAPRPAPIVAQHGPDPSPGPVSALPASPGAVADS